ncbi:MAG: fluoride efflux transporter CrcB [Alphaproteobacteria bacterium]|nr:fluoride efflux transporter CrcB [Alphaproteobacteria bacterium]
MTYLWIALGSALGGIARFWCSSTIDRMIGETFPWGTFMVNVTGSFVIGLLGTLSGPEGRWFLPTDARIFVMVGLCGGYTTFSSFSYQTLNLARDGEWLWAGANVVMSVVVCLAAVWFGHVAAAAINR